MSQDHGQAFAIYGRGEHPYTILNGYVWHNATRVCSSGGFYAKACPNPLDSTWGIQMQVVHSD